MEFCVSNPNSVPGDLATGSKPPQKAMMKTKTMRKISLVKFVK
jgi:hypothetical protein